MLEIIPIIGRSRISGNHPYLILLKKIFDLIFRKHVSSNTARWRAAAGISGIVSRSNRRL